MFFTNKGGKTMYQVYLYDGNHAFAKGFSEVVTLAVYPYKDALTVASRYGLEEHITTKDCSYLLMKNKEHFYRMYPILSYFTVEIVEM